MKVLKFGGTSVANAESIRKVGGIISRESDRIVVVVSALGGITDQILKAAGSAVHATGSVEAEVAAIRKRHTELIHELLGENREVLQSVGNILTELEQVLTGIALVNETTPKTQDRILGMGERMSSVIISAFLGVKLVDTAGLIVTDSSFGKALVDYEETFTRITKALGNESQTVLVPGFIAKNK